MTARKLGIPVYFTEGTHRAWMRIVTPRKRMTYSQWLEQCRQQAADRLARAQAEGVPDAVELFSEPISEGKMCIRDRRMGDDGISLVGGPFHF